jgi:hypothetical protein
LKLSPERLGSWTWILIYGGLIVMSLGLALQQQGRAYGIGVIVAGALAAAAGAVLIWVRSRMGDDAHPSSSHPQPGASHEHPRP